MLCRGQNCKFCHIESYGKNDVTNSIKLQSTYFFPTPGAYLYDIYISLLVFKNYSRSYKMAPELILHFFWLTLYITMQQLQSALSSQRNLDMHMMRPKRKKMFVCPFPTDPKYWKIRVSFFFFFFFFKFDSEFCIFKQKCWNKMSEYIVTVPKRHFNQIHCIMEYNSPPAPGLNQFWGTACPKSAHTWMILLFFCVQIKKERRKK